MFLQKLITDGAVVLRRRNGQDRNEPGRGTQLAINTSSLPGALNFDVLFHFLVIQVLL